MPPGPIKFSVAQSTPPRDLGADAHGQLPGNEKTGKSDDPLVAGVEDMDVWRVMITEVHSDGDSVEPANFRHLSTVGT
jgi:hypothetical protein